MSTVISTDLGFVVLKEVMDDYEKGNGPDGPYLHKSYYLEDYALLDATLNTLMGITYGVGGIGGTIIRTAPHQCPEEQNLFLVSVGPAKGFGGASRNNGAPFYPGGAIIPCLYGPPTFQYGGNLNDADPYNAFNFSNDVYPFCTQSIDYDSESYTIEGNWKYATGPAAGKPITGSYQTIDIPTAVMSVTLHRVPYMPKRQIFDLLKSVNQYKFLDEDPWTVFFDKARTTRVKNSDGTISLEINYQFKWRKTTHLRVPDPIDGSSNALVTNDGTAGGTTIYPINDLRPIFFGMSLS